MLPWHSLSVQALGSREGTHPGHGWELRGDTQDTADAEKAMHPLRTLQILKWNDRSPFPGNGIHICRSWTKPWILFHFQIHIDIKSYSANSHETYSIPEAWQRRRTEVTGRGPNSSACFEWLVLDIWGIDSDKMYNGSKVGKFSMWFSSLGI